MQHERNPADATVAAYRELLDGVDRALAVPGLPSNEHARLLRIRRPLTALAATPAMRVVADAGTAQLQVACAAALRALDDVRNER